MPEQLIEQYLSDLGEELGRTGRSVEIVVCGAHAMRVQGLSDRRTYDVDVMGTLVEGRIEKLRFEPWLKEAVQRVAVTRGVPADWLNPGGEIEVALGLPPGIESRLVTREYGTSLKVHYVARIDLLFMKLNAALERGGRQEDDVKRMEPKLDELVRAARFCIEREGRKVSPITMSDYLERLGYIEAAGRIREEY